MTVHDHVSAARARFIRAGIQSDSAGLDAEILARRVLGWDRAAYFSQSHCAPPASFDARYADLVARRARREPLSLITGRREFWGLEFEVTPDVLIPRPETELIVEEAIAAMGDAADPFLLVDAGTGCGCLAIALAVTLPASRVIATDISSAALDVARRNARRHRVSDRIEWRQTSFLAGLECQPDLIVSNPPYVPTPHLATLQPEVRDYEPALALSGGTDGLNGLRELTAQADTCLSSGGLLIVEFGLDQEDALRRLVVARPGLSVLKVKHDLQGFPRVAVLRRC